MVTRVRWSPEVKRRAPVECRGLAGLSLYYRTVVCRGSSLLFFVCLLRKFLFSFWFISLFCFCQPIFDRCDPDLVQSKRFHLWVRDGASWFCVACGDQRWIAQKYPHNSLDVTWSLQKAQVKPVEVLLNSPWSIFGTHSNRNNVTELRVLCLGSHEK